jgi:hypothetical protein
VYLALLTSSLEEKREMRKKRKMRKTRKMRKRREKEGRCKGGNSGHLCVYAHARLIVLIV